MSALRQAWRFLGRIGVASSLLFLLLLVALLAALIPQLPPSIARDPARLAAWLTAAQERWGPVMVILHRWGLLTVYRFPFLAGLLSVLALSTLSCTLSRWRAAWRRALRRAAPPVEFPLSLSPLPADRLRSALRERGYRVRTASGEGTTYLEADRYPLSELATLATHLAVLLLAVACGLSGWLGWQAEVTVGAGEAVPVGGGADLWVRNDSFAIVHSPDGSVADYRAEIALLGGEQEVARGWVRVNHPLRFGGMAVYLWGFQDREGGMSVTLKVVRDPGAGLALAGGLLLLLGVTASAYLPHRRICARLEPERTLLAVRSSGRDDAAAAELEALVRELGEC